MSIHFDFTVTEEEASTLFELVSDAAVGAKFHATGALPAAEREWWERHARYLEELRKKMNSSRVP